MMRVVVMMLIVMIKQLLWNIVMVLIMIPMMISVMIITFIFIIIIMIMAKDDIHADSGTCNFIMNCNATIEKTPNPEKRMNNTL